MSIIEELQALQVGGVADAQAAPDLATLEAVRVGYLGKKGSLTAILRGLGGLTAEERPAVGKVANEIRAAREAAIDVRGRELEAKALEARVSAEAVDVTLPGHRRTPGRVHLID